MAAHARRLDGDVILVQPVSIRILALLCVSIAGVALGFLAWTGHARTERVSGYLEPDAGASPALPLRSGTIAEVHVALGDRVRAGQILVRVAAASHLSDGSILEESLRSSLERQSAELAAKQQAMRETFERQQARRRQELAALDRKLRHAQSLRKLAEERRDLASRRAENTRALVARGFASESQYREHRELVLAHEKELEQLASSAIDDADQRARLRAELEAMPSTLRQEEADLGVQRLEIDARRREVEARAGYAITSPIEGRIAALQAMPGGTVTVGVPVAVVVPLQARLEAVLLVPTRAAGFIRVGQPVGLKYHAFPYQEFGIQPARIHRIDTAILGAAELRAPIAVQEPVYRVSAELANQRIMALGSLLPLQSGMRLDADIVLETRSLLAWLLEPIYGIRGPWASASAS